MQTLKVLLSAAFILSVPFSSLVRADKVGNEGDDWAALHAVEKRNAEESDAALRAKALLDFYRARSKMHPPKYFRARFGVAKILSRPIVNKACKAVYWSRLFAPTLSPCHNFSA